MTGINVFLVRKICTEIFSEPLDRIVKIDFYLPADFDNRNSYPLLIVNDGQDLDVMEFDLLFGSLQEKIEPIIIAAIHCGPDRKMEYGVTGIPDFMGRGAKAGAYADFIFNEFLPDAAVKLNLKNFKEKSIAGFSLGGLSALDIAWSFPGEFNYAAVFSGSLWWRSVDQSEKKYDDDRHRIMHHRIRQGKYNGNLKFFFQCGNKDETKDRNNNGIIDSIDDTLDLIKELKAKDCPEPDIFYYEMKDGRHDVFTWGRAFPVFLEWAFRRKS